MSDDTTSNFTNLEQTIVHDTWNQSRTSDELRSFVERRFQACAEEL